MYTFLGWFFFSLLMVFFFSLSLPFLKPFRNGLVPTNVLQFVILDLEIFKGSQIIMYYIFYLTTVAV